MKEEKKENVPERKSILAWVREILGRTAPEIETLPSPPPEEVVESLIGKAAGDDANPGSSGNTEDTADSENKAKPNQTDSLDKPEKKGCAFAMKRNLVLSLQEIRKFAEKHSLTSIMIRALLTLLAEMAIGAMKGKVGEKALDALLKAFNYEAHVNDAYLRGKNDRITEDFFPDGDDGLPHFNGLRHPADQRPDIFSMAREAWEG